MSAKGIWRPCYCYSCLKFPLKRESVERNGIERCPEWEREVKWNDRACVLHMPAKDETARRPLVIQIKQQTGEELKDD